MNRRELFQVSLGAGLALASLPVPAQTLSEGSAAATLAEHAPGLAGLSEGTLGPLTLVRAVSYVEPSAASDMEPLGEWGVYWLQQALLTSGSAPQSVLCLPAGDEPGACVTTIRFAQFTAILERRGDGEAERLSECCFHGAGGTLRMDAAGGWSFHPAGAAGEAGIALRSRAVLGAGARRTLQLTPDTHRVLQLAERSLNLGCKLAWEPGAPARASDSP